MLLLLIFIICFVVGKLLRNFVLHVAAYLGGLKEGSNSQELQSKLTIGMAFQFDLYLTDWAFCSLRIPLGFVSVQATDKNLSDLLLSTFKRFELAFRSMLSTLLLTKRRSFIKFKLCERKKFVRWMWINDKIKYFQIFLKNLSW